MGQRKYFSERESGAREPEFDEISDRVWRGIVALVRSREADQSFASAFPVNCPDPERNTAVCGTDDDSFYRTLDAEIPDLDWSPPMSDVPPADVVMDLIEFLYDRIADAQEAVRHDYYGHHHLRFNQHRGKQRLVDDVNRLFRRNGLAYQLQDEGAVVRLAPFATREALTAAHVRHWRR